MRQAPRRHFVAYTVYCDLWIADANGKIVAHGRPDRFPGLVGQSVAHERWFRSAMATRSGDEYVCDDVAVVPALATSRAAVYATAVREAGEANGAPIGALGIFFDWAPRRRLSYLASVSIRTRPTVRAR